jgi:peroxiredoxin
MGQRALGLPTSATGGWCLFRRLTMVVSSGEVEHVFYLLIRPDRHATKVIDWLRASQVGRETGRSRT